MTGRSDAHRRSLDVGQLGRLASEHGPRNGDELRVCAAVCQAEDLVALLPLRRACVLDRPGEFDAQDLGRAGR